MTVKARTEKLKLDIEQTILEFRNETGLFPHVSIEEEITGSCATKINITVSVEEELLLLEIA